MSLEGSRTPNNLTDKKRLSPCASQEDVPEPVRFQSGHDNPCFSWTEYCLFVGAMGKWLTFQTDGR